MNSKLKRKETGNHVDSLPKLHNVFAMTACAYTAHTHTSTLNIVYSEYTCVSSAILQHFVHDDWRITSKLVRFKVDAFTAKKFVAEFVCWTELDWIKRTPFTPIWLRLFALVVFQPCYRSNYPPSIYFCSVIFSDSFSKRCMYTYTCIHTYDSHIPWVCARDRERKSVRVSNRESSEWKKKI